MFHQFICAMLIVSAALTDGGQMDSSLDDLVLTTRLKRAIAVLIGSVLIGSVLIGSLRRWLRQGSP